MRGVLFPLAELVNRADNVFMFIFRNIEGGGMEKIKKIKYKKNKWTGTERLFSP